MILRDDRRASALDGIARHLLRAGLPGASLRSLAAAAGMSDRMLLYYFADKHEVLTLALGMLAAEMAVALDRSVPPAPRRGFAELLGEIRQAVRGGALRPFMRLWLEIASRASRDQAPYTAIAGAIADGFEAWISMRLDADGDAEAALLLAAVEGMVVLDGVGRGNLADAAAGLPSRRTRRGLAPGGGAP